MPEPLLDYDSASGPPSPAGLAAAPYDTEAGKHVANYPHPSESGGAFYANYPGPDIDANYFKTAGPLGSSPQLAMTPAQAAAASGNYAPPHSDDMGSAAQASAPAARPPSVLASLYEPFIRAKAALLHTEPSPEAGAFDPAKLTPEQVQAVLKHADEHGIERPAKVAATTGGT